MRVTGSVEINKTTLWGAGLALAFIIVVVSIIGFYRSVLDSEYSLYRAAVKENTIAAHKAYLEFYPRGRFVGRVNRGLNFLYRNEYRVMLRFIMDNAHECVNICTEYAREMRTAEMTRAGVARVLDETHARLELKGAFKKLSNNNKKIETFLQYGSVLDSKYKEIHEYLADFYQQYLKLYYMAVVPPVDTPPDVFIDSMSDAFKQVVRTLRTINVKIAKYIAQEAKGAEPIETMQQ